MVLIRHGQGSNASNCCESSHERTNNRVRQLSPAPLVTQVAVKEDLHKTEETPAKVHDTAVCKIDSSRFIVIGKCDGTIVEDVNFKLPMVIVMKAHLRFVRIPGTDHGHVRRRFDHI